jgi:hypothetical protein
MVGRHIHSISASSLSTPRGGISGRVPNTGRATSHPVGRADSVVDWMRGGSAPLKGHRSAGFGVRTRLARHGSGEGELTIPPTQRHTYSEHPTTMPFGLPSQRQKDLDRKGGPAPPASSSRTPPTNGERPSSSAPDGPTQEENQLADEIEIGTLSADPQTGEPPERQDGPTRASRHPSRSQVRDCMSASWSTAPPRVVPT